MSLDIYLTATTPHTVFDANITHNLGRMAKEGGIYEALWHPVETGVSKAGELIPLLAAATKAMRDDPARFKAHDAKNGWGTYEDFLPWLDNLLAACTQYPDAEISVSI